MRNRAMRSKWGSRRKGGAGVSTSTLGARAHHDRTAGRKDGDGTDLKRTFERYVEMAKAAASSGDAVESEKYYQYADHFLRLMKAAAR